MTEPTTAKQQENEEEGSQNGIIVLEIFAVFFYTLSLAASIVIMLRPLGVLPSKAFTGNAASALWLLFTFGITFGIVLHTLGATKRTMWKFSKFGGIVDLILGSLCAVEIFLLKAYGVTARTTSLWWLFVAVTVFGTISVYLTVRAKRLEDEEAKRKADEARARQRRTSPTIVRLKNRRYYVCEQKIFVCKD